jgi:hypothetical protein
MKKKSPKDKSRKILVYCEKHQKGELNCDQCPNKDFCDTGKKETNKKKAGE